LGLLPIFRQIDAFRPARGLRSATGVSVMDMFGFSMER
jgi:hypothetical protein